EILFRVQKPREFSRRSEHHTITQHNIALINKDKIARHTLNFAGFYLVHLIGDRGVAGRPNIAWRRFKSGDFSRGPFVLRLLPEPVNQHVILGLRLPGPLFVEWRAMVFAIRRVYSQAFAVGVQDESILVRVTMAERAVR